MVTANRRIFPICRSLPGWLLAAFGLVGLGALRFVRPPQPPPFGLTIALVITSLNTAQNVLVFALLRRAARDGTSIPINGQLRARVSKTAATVCVAMATDGTASRLGHWVRTNVEPEQPNDIEKQG
jgi:hypothetical protein